MANSQANAPPTTCADSVTARRVQGLPAAETTDPIQTRTRPRPLLARNRRRRLRLPDNVRARAPAKEGQLSTTCAAPLDESPPACSTAVAQAVRDRHPAPCREDGARMKVCPSCPSLSYRSPRSRNPAFFRARLSSRTVGPSPATHQRSAPPREQRRALVSPSRRLHPRPIVSWIINASLTKLEETWTFHNQSPVGHSDRGHDTLSACHTAENRDSPRMRGHRSTKTDAF